VNFSIAFRIAIIVICSFMVGVDIFDIPSPSDGQHHYIFPRWVDCGINILIVIRFFFRIGEIRAQHLAVLIPLFLSSCVDFKAQSGAHYHGPPWGKVAYSKGDEMWTSDHDTGWIATVTGIQNIAGTIGMGYGVGQATKVNLQNNNADVVKNASNNALSATKAKLAAPPTVLNPGQTAVFPPTK
jgi:hypothetical protein